MRDIKIVNGLKKLIVSIPPLALLFLCISCSGVNYSVFRGNRHAQKLERDHSSYPTKGSRGTYKVGAPYTISGKEYYPEENRFYRETGIASWYGEEFHRKKTANGDIFDMNSMTAAHRTLPMPSVVRVVNLENGKSVLLLVNDRGPFAKNRIIDVSKMAAQKLGFLKMGTTHVRVEFMEKETKKLLKSRGLL
ncbi:MAG: septal ring lytic transglycosylase RlpA family protein [Rickettsiales bacterium]|jgi:rare lipoprotein A|nr:septal ring lytic transglycosylase RlpA family protein [Rickettsiales bacterium]